MKKQNLILAVILMITAAAATAQAGGPAIALHSIADADALDPGLDRAAEPGRGYVMAKDGIADADSTDPELDRAEDRGRAVEIAFDPVLDADIGEGAGTSRLCTAENEVALR